MHLLVIEDDEKIGSFIQQGFKEEGFTVDWIKDGAEALEVLKTSKYDVLIVDRMIPNLDGLSVLKQIREWGNKTPAVVLSARSGLEDRVEGLEKGADTYLGKPFAFSELRAIVRALLKRSSQTLEDAIHIKDLEIRTDKFLARRGGKNLDLTPKEFQLLLMLARNKNRVVTRTGLLENVWGIYFETDTNLVDVHIRRLRSKLDDGFDYPLIKTVRGVGYKISDDD